MEQEYIGTGRRKTSVASVRLRRGAGSIDVNGKKMDEYFPTELLQRAALVPFTKAGVREHYDIIIRVKGGGIESQTGAIRLGLARALVKEDENRKEALKDCGFLKRDDRKKERKKYGRAGARKRFQFSKR